MCQPAFHPENWIRDGKENPKPSAGHYMDDTQINMLKVFDASKIIDQSKFQWIYFKQIVPTAIKLNWIEL